MSTGQAVVLGFQLEEYGIAVQNRSEVAHFGFRCRFFKEPHDIESDLQETVTKPGGGWRKLPKGANDRLTDQSDTSRRQGFQ